jgi:hypothetical protein
MLHCSIIPENSTTPAALLAEAVASVREATRSPDRIQRIGHDRYLSITTDGAGGVRLKGRGTAEDGARRRDPREHGARMWDALVQIAHHALDTDLPPEPHGARLRLTTTVAQAAGP